MRGKWIFTKLKSNVPSWPCSLLFPFKAITPSKIILNHVEVSGLLSICGRENLLLFGASLHASIVKNPEFYEPGFDQNVQSAVVMWNSLLSMYAKCGEMENARKLFDEMPIRDSVSWNSMISGHLRNGEFEIGFRVLRRMQEMGCSCRFDQATFTTVLSSCEGDEFHPVIEMMHCFVILIGHGREISVGNSLITSYFNCGLGSSGRKVFDEMLERNVITWTAAISGLAQNEFYQDAFNLFLRMRKGAVIPNFLTYLTLVTVCSGLQALGEGHQVHGLVLKLGLDSDLCIESAFMDMYCKCHGMEDAWKIFESAEWLDEISMTVILVGFAQNGYEEEAIQIFLQMLNGGSEIDPNMVSAILGVFGFDTSLVFGQQIHSLAIKRRLASNLFVSNGLINMYSKCGNLEDSIKVFHQMTKRNSVSWNSLIAAFGRHGDVTRALQFYEEMRLEQVEPTDVTFLSLLHVCAHVGLIGKGFDFLESMSRDYCISPRTEHYACIVDMLGRAGLLDEAKRFIEGLPTKEKPSVLLWQALLGACGIHGDSETGKYAADQLFSAAPDSQAAYILLANIYSAQGRWKERARTIRKMKEKGMTKETGISWLEIDKKVHTFVVEDRMHPQAETIYTTLADLFLLMIDEGYVPDKRFIPYYMNQDGKEAELKWLPEEIHKTSALKCEDTSDHISVHF